jgi:hypothetical protein
MSIWFFCLSLIEIIISEYRLAWSCIYFFADETCLCMAGIPDQSQCCYLAWCSAYLEHLDVSLALVGGENGSRMCLAAYHQGGDHQGSREKAQGCTSWLFVEKKAWCFGRLAHKWMYPFISRYNMYVGLCLRFSVLKPCHVSDLYTYTLVVASLMYLYPH